MEKLSPKIASWQQSTEPLKTSNKTVAILKCLKALFSAYRPDQFADPEGFTTNAAAVLDQYPMETVEFVTSPRTGIQRRCTWPPSVKELVDACDEHVAGVARRERFSNWGSGNPAIEGPKTEKPTLEELKAKYGENWGLSPHGGEDVSTGFFDKPIPSWDEITTNYAANPSRIAELISGDK